MTFRNTEDEGPKISLSTKFAEEYSICGWYKLNPLKAYPNVWLPAFRISIKDPKVTDA